MNFPSSKKSKFVPQRKHFHFLAEVTFKVKKFKIYENDVIGIAFARSC